MGIGAIAANAVVVANMAATKRRREETPVVEERQCTVLLDTGSKLASWLIERGSATLEMSGEVGLAQQNAAIQFHQHLSFCLRYVNSNLGMFESLTLSATIINDLRIDVILGLPTVGKYNLLPKLTNLCGCCCTPKIGAWARDSCSSFVVKLPGRLALANCSTLLGADRSLAFATPRKPGP